MAASYTAIIQQDGEWWKGRGGSWGHIFFPPKDPEPGD